MKNLKKLYEELSARKDFQIVRQGFDGGIGIFTKGSQMGMTVIWSYGGGWEHISIDGKHRMPTWDEMCQLKDMFFEEEKTLTEWSRQFHFGRNTFRKYRKNFSSDEETLCYFATKQI